MARLLLSFIFIHLFFVRISGPYLIIWQAVSFCLQVMYSIVSLKMELVIFLHAVAALLMKDDCTYRDVPLWCGHIRQLCLAQSK